MSSDTEDLISLDELEVVAEKFTIQLCDLMMQVLDRPLDVSSILLGSQKRHGRSRRLSYHQIIKDFHR